MALLKQHNFLSSKPSLNTNYQKTKKQQQQKNTGKCTVTVLTGQLFHFWWGGRRGGGFLGEFSVANYFFQPLHSSWIFFWSIFLHQMSFFCLQHGEIITIHYYSIQFLQHSHISERFRVGVGTKRSKLSLAAWEFDVVLEIENPKPKKIGPS